MNPIKAQRTWNTLSAKWITASPYGAGPFYNRRTKRPKRKSKIKKGLLVNFIPVEVVNAITGEVAKGYMRDLSIRRLRKWLEYHNHRAQVEQVFLPEKSTLRNLSDVKIHEFPILIKLGKYQVPYLIERRVQSQIVKGKQTVTFDLKTADNLKYLEIIAGRKDKIMNVFNKIKKGRTTKKKPVK